MKCITEMLGLLLRAKDFDEALRLLPKIAELIRGGKKLKPLDDDYVVGPSIFDEAAQQEKQKMELLHLYGGILAVHGVRTTEAVGQARVVEGALALLDIAADSNLSSLIRRTAFQYGLYAVEKFVPKLYPADGQPVPSLGARIVYDWVRWQIEAERNPDHASRLAEAYALVASPRDATDSVQISEQQWRAALRASQRSDLDPDLRRDLWRSLSYGQNWKRRLFFGLLRRFGPFADPRPPAPVQQAA